MFQVWRRRTQEVEVSKDERKKERESGTITRSVEEGEGALGGKETASKRSNNEHKEVDNKMGGGYPCGM